jgi:hypothetical protein
VGDSEKQKSLDLLLFLIVRRAVCGLTSKNYNNLFLSVIADLERKGWTYNNLRAYAIAADHGEEVAVHAAAAMATAALKAIDAACPNADFLVSGL